MWSCSRRMSISRFPLADMGWIWRYWNDGIHGRAICSFEFHTTWGLYSGLWSQFFSSHACDTYQRVSNVIGQGCVSKLTSTVQFVSYKVQDHLSSHVDPFVYHCISLVVFCNVGRYIMNFEISNCAINGAWLFCGASGLLQFFVADCASLGGSFLTGAPLCLLSCCKDLLL